MADPTPTEQIVAHEKLCFAMVMALARDTEEAHAATVKVLASREKLLREWAAPTGEGETPE